MLDIDVGAINILIWVNLINPFGTIEYNRTFKTNVFHGLKWKETIPYFIKSLHWNYSKKYQVDYGGIG